VADVPASVRFYRDVLGFKLDWGAEGDSSRIGSVSRDGHAIMLQQRKGGTPGVVWIGVDSIVPLWDKVKSDPSVKIVQRPTNQPWALEMRIADPGGNVLWFGMDSLKDVPFGKEPADAQLPR
jgi:catechol 2,3-dioxygenase-like lactoylglutathione lyase family enzyme